MIHQTLPVHLGVHATVSTLCSLFLIFQPPPPTGLLSLIRGWILTAWKTFRPTHRSPGTGFVASRNKQVSSAKVSLTCHLSQYLTRESCLICFNVSALFCHRGEWGKHSKRSSRRSVWWVVCAQSAGAALFPCLHTFAWRWATASLHSQCKWLA